MTKNQIEYAKLLEARRSNQAQEVLIAERDAETARHNVEMESLDRTRARETERANRAQEAYRSQQLAISLDELGEKQRASMAIESLRQQELAESVRHSQAVELETHRANTVKESQTWSEIAESARAHRASEVINMSSVEQRREQAQLTYQAQMISLNETKRHNIEAEREQARSASAREAETRRSNLAHEAEVTRSNQAREVETNRHNLASEQAQQTQATARMISSITQAVGEGSKIIGLFTHGKEKRK